MRKLSLKALIVFGAIDLAAEMVLLAIDLRPLTAGKVSIVCCPVEMDFAIDVMFLTLDVSGFTCV